MAKTLYYEDVRLGDVLPRLIKGPLTHTDLVKYSGASGDFNPLHTVPEHARERAGLPGLIGHGMLSMAYAGQVVTNWMGPDGEVKRLKAQFRAMTFLDDEIVCEGIVADKRETKDGNLVDVNITVTAGRDERRTVVGSATVALPSRGKKRAPKKAATRKKRPKKKAAKKAAKKTVRKKTARKKAVKKKAAKKAGRKKAPKRKAPKRRAPARRAPKRKAPKRKTTRKTTAAKRRKRR